MSEKLTIADYEEVLADHRRLIRLLDVELNGKVGAAPQASLCDLVEDVRRVIQRRDAALADVARLRAALEPVGFLSTGEQIIQRVLQDACELPDRTSPEDQPEMLLITCDELDMLLRRHLGLEGAALAASAPQPSIEEIMRGLHAVDCADADRDRQLDRLPPVKEWADPRHPGSARQLANLRRRAEVFSAAFASTSAPQPDGGGEG